MKKVLFVLLDQWADWEAAYLSSAIRMLAGQEYCTQTVALTKEKVESIGGFHVIPDYDIYTVPEDYEAVILIGGMSWRNENALQIKTLVEQCIKKGKVLGAICDATVFLGGLGILNDIKHTSNTLNDLKQWAGSIYTGEKNYICRQSVSNQNIVTANGTATLEFAKDVMLALHIESYEKIMEWYNFHKLGFYNAPLPKDVNLD